MLCNQRGVASSIETRIVKIVLRDHWAHLSFHLSWNGKTGAMQPAFGRFHSIPHASGRLLFVRLTEGSTLEVLATDIAFRTKLFDSKRPAQVRGKKQPPSLELIALLLIIPSTTALLVQNGEMLELSSDDLGKDVSLQLRCKDRSGVELVVTANMEPMPAKRILEEMHESLFSAIVALEAIVRDAGGEKHSNFLDEKRTESPTLETIKTSLLPLAIRGQPVEAQAVFRRAAAADARMQGNRAFVVADAAGRIRAELLEQRRARKEAEMLKKKREREMLRVAKRKHDMMKAAKGKSVSVGKRKKKSLFAVPDEDLVSTPALLKSTAKATVPGAVMPDEKGADQRSLATEQEAASVQVEKQNEQKVEAVVLEARKPVPKEEEVPVDEVETVPSTPKPPPLKRKKKKKGRALV